MKTEKELEWLYGLERFGIKPGLAVMEQMMEALGHPERAFKSIHVTGTNGKGSVCAMVESVLRNAGYNTAMYTSPHLYTFHERIRVGGINIDNDVFLRLVAEIRAVCEVHNIHPTFFEFTTALAFLHFSRSNIDIAIIEVGMGGRYDATNVITPVISVITNIGLDHMDYIGPTKEHIAREKAGIIKEGVPVVTGEKDPQLLKIFEQEAALQHTQITRAQDVVRVQQESSDEHGQEVIVSGEYAGNVHLPLLGKHQLRNLETALAVISLFPSTSRPLSWESIASGIESTVWEGRMHIISQKPRIIIDGAHNADGARALAAFLKTLDRHDVIVVAAKRGKDIADMAEKVIPLFSHVIVTEGSYMPESADVLAKRFTDAGISAVRSEPNVGQAILDGMKLAGPNGTLVITGSLYMVADALAYLRSINV